MQEFIDAGLLRSVDIAFAQLVDELLDESLSRGRRRMVVLGAALASRAPQRGHVGVDLATIATSASIDSPRSADGDQRPAIDQLPWPDPKKWKNAFTKMLKAHQLTGVVRTGQPLLPNAPRSLMVFHNGLLYTDRLFSYEETVHRALKGLASNTRSTGDLLTAGIEGSLDTLFPHGGAQANAARHALTHRLSVIAGGPGTGKTYTITRILAALTSIESPKIGLAAPTGKAAGRMKEAIAAASQELGAEVAGRLGDIQASTIHRMLGFRDGIRFAHDQANPLPFDVVVIDEVSMVSLPLMGRLLAAIGPSTRLILVGDQYQLASVEAGAVLGDITSSGAFADSTVVTLTDSRRFDDSSGVGRLTRAIHRGDDDEVMAILDDPSISDVRRVDPSDADGVAELVITKGCDALERAQANDASGALELGGATKVLCATRRGQNGLDQWQKRIEIGVRSRVNHRDFRGSWYVGRPLIVTANDYLLGLFNGDTGVVVRSPSGARVVEFPDSDNTEQLNTAQLGDFETWWAMTIHKSQGSEFPHAVVCLPEAGSPILTRELLYTGVSRARTEVTVVADEVAIRAAVTTPIRRASGLAQMLA